MSARDRPPPRGGCEIDLTDEPATLELSDLYVRYWKLVVAYLRGQGAVDPEDLASEAFVGVVRGLESFQGDEAAFRSWVLVIAHRRLLDDRRRRGRRPAHVVRTEELHAVVDTSSIGRVEETALDRVSTTGVLAALECLTDDQRTVVLLHTVGGLTLPQIAQLLHKRLAAVKSLHRRGLAAAARALASPVAGEPVLER